MDEEKLSFVFQKNENGEFKKYFGVAEWTDMGLKKPVLYLYHESKNLITKVASFNNREAAEAFVECMKKFLETGE